jgi:hypothetical protein
MSEAAALTLVSFIILLATRIVTQKVTVFRISETICRIVHELDQNQAYDLFTAVDLPQVQNGFTRVGYRNFRSSAVEILTQQGVVKKTGSGKLYLRSRLEDERVQRNLRACDITVS